MTTSIEMEAFLGALRRLPAVYDTKGHVDTLAGVTEDHLRKGEFADLPLATLQRTAGGIAKEALAQFFFAIDPTAHGLRSLEFLAFALGTWALDGHRVQLRVLANAPFNTEGVQLGQTLRFVIDLFSPETGNDLAPLMRLIQELADKLVTQTGSHDHELRERGEKKGLL